MSPTARTLKAMRDMGYRTQGVEQWNHFARKRVDLFGFIDGVSVGKGIIIGWQATTGTNLVAHLEKIRKECADAAWDWLFAGARIQVWAWRKVSPRGTRAVRWKPIMVEIGLDGAGRMVEVFRGDLALNVFPD